MGRASRRKLNRRSGAIPPALQPVQEETDSGGSRKTHVALLVITVATILVYSNTFDAQFHLDDLDSIVQNETLRDLHNFWLPKGNRYFGYLSFALNYRLGALDAFGYHLANLLIHLCNSLLVFWLTRITLRTPALRRAEAGPLVRRYLPLAAGLLFAVHPLATQAVTYIVQRFTSLATLFYLLSLALYAQARLSLEADRPSKLRVACLYLLSVAAAAGAMRTKEISFTLPFVAAGYDLLFFRLGKRFLLLAPLAATALLVPLGLATQGQGFADVLRGAGHFAAETREIPRSVYLLTQSRVVVTYLRLLLLPVQQNLDYDFRLSYSLADPSVLLALVVLIAVGGFATFLMVRARRTNSLTGMLVFFGVAWFFVTLSVESSIVPIRDVIFEHRVYLPSAGAVVTVGAALLWAVERLRLRVPLSFQATVTLLISAGPLGVATYSRNLVWKNDLTLWSDVVAKSPQKARPHNHLGLAYLKRGRTSDAVREYAAAVRLDPGVATGHGNLGAAYLENGQLDDAVREFRVAIRLDPELATAHNGLGNAYKAKSQLDDAIREHLEAIRLDPRWAVARNNLGAVYQAESQFDDAIREFREAIRLDPELATAHSNLGAAYQAKGQFDYAAREFREAIRLAPKRAEAYNDLGLILVKQGRASDAVEVYRRAFELNPLPEIVFNLALALEAAGRPAEAILEYQHFLDEAGVKYPDRAENVRSRIAQLRAAPEARPPPSTRRAR